MANKSRPADDVASLKAENRRLKEENARLNRLVANSDTAGTPRQRKSFSRSTGVFLLSLLAVLVLFAGNIFFWTGNAIVKNNRFVDATAPLIREEKVQTAISSYATQQFFTTVNVEQIAEESLPPRAAFLAPTLADQVEQNAEKVIQGILKNPSFQEKWNNVLSNSHDRFINQAKQHGSDGTIDLGELYTDQISPQLKDTKLAFLADKPLPDKVGEVQLVEGAWLSKLETLINNIDTWRTIALLLLVVFTVLAVWLSRNRRRTVIALGFWFSVVMFLTLILIRLAREIVADKVDPQFADAAREATQTLLHPLAVQTATILALGLLIAIVAWISGPSRSARRVSELIQGLFAGKLHGALFKQENTFTLWVGRNKSWLQWGVIVLIAVALLVIRLTPKALGVAAIAALLLILMIEALAAEQPKPLRLSQP